MWRDLYLVGAAFFIFFAVMTAKAAFGERIKIGLSRYRKWLAAALDELNWEGDAERYVRLHVIATVGLTLAVALVIGWLPAFLVAGFCVWGVYFFIVTAKEKRQAQFEAQLPGTLDSISAALGQGLNLEQAIEITAQNVDEPTSTELLLTMKEYRLGIQLDQALLNTGERLKSRNLGMVSEAVGIATKTGGDLSNMLQKTARSVQEIAALEEKMNVATSQGRMQTRVIVAMGPLTLLGLSLISPEVVNPLFTEPLGWFMLATAVALNVIGVLLARKIQEADV